MDGEIIGIDIGGTNFRIGTVSAGETVSDFRKIPVGQIFLTADPLCDLGAYLEEYCRRKTAGAVSIGFPATLDRERRRVLQAPNVPFMENLPVVEALSKRLSIPVVIERDVTMALFYDMKEYHIPAAGITVGIYFGTGIGNSVCIDGVPLKGRHGTAGELGHIPVDGSNLICGCGNAGCMENLAGGKYLVRLCETVFPDTSVSELFVKHGGDPLLAQFVDRMAMVCASEINILDPDTILIGGGVPGMVGFPLELLEARIRAHARKPYPADDLNLIFAGDAENKSVIGAAIYARSALKR